MKLVKLAAGVLNQTPLDWDRNLQNIVDCIAAARAENVNVLCLPELCLTGYGCEDAFHSPGVVETAEELLHEVVPHTQGMAVSVGLPLLVDGSLYNCAGLLVDGAIAGFIAKQHLAGDGIHYEPRWFKPWPCDVGTEFHFGGDIYPLGDFCFDVGGIRIGFEICEDAWVGERPGAALAARGVDIILNPSASHFAFGKHEIRKRFVLEGSRAFHVSYVYANLLGNESGRAIFDGDAMIASRGKMLASGPRLSYRDYLLTTALVDVNLTRMERSRSTSYVPEPEEAAARRYFVLGNVTSESLSRAIDDVKGGDHSTAALGGWHMTAGEVCEAWPQTKEEEFSHAVALALFDYVRKSRSQGVVVSLSGGADSAAVALLCRLMFEFSVMELGVTTVCEKLGLKSAEPSDEVSLQIDRWTSQFITTLYQATKNSSDVTRDAARDVAKAVHSDHLEIDIDSLVEQYTERIESAIGHSLTWEQDDIALQNIQARTRSPGAWMLANLRNALLLSTNNRSEAAVGYATMDGDTSGGLSPIAGIDKAFLRRWLVWMENEGPQGLHPFPGLAAVNRQQPTAELRPAAAAQTDESDLMPYEILDQIERWAIRDKRLPAEVNRLLAFHYPDVDATTRLTWIKRFFQLWSRNQWKRERYAPSFHLDDENLDPKTWCRFPILSGGFRRELLALESAVGKRDDGATSNPRE